jgi:hypothetical protein
MATARLESYKQGFGADVFVWNAGIRIEIVVGWGLLQPGLTVARSLNPDGTRNEVLGQWMSNESGFPFSAHEAIRALGYDHLIVPPWLAAVVRNANEVR